MSWDIGITRYEGSKREHLGCAVTYQRRTAPDMGEVLFDHKDVYEQTDDNLLGDDGTFLVDISFKPNWLRLKERIQIFIAESPNYPGINAYKQLLIGVEEVLASGDPGSYRMHIG